MLFQINEAEIKKPQTFGKFSQLLFQKGQLKLHPVMAFKIISKQKKRIF